MKLRPRFGLRTLFVATTVVAVACYVVPRHLAAQAARDDLDRVCAGYDAGVKTNKSIYIASRRLCEAESRVPLASKVAAHAMHVARMHEVRRRVENLCAFGKDPPRIEDEVDGYCEEAEAGLEAVLGRRLLP